MELGATQAERFISTCYEYHVSYHVTCHVIPATKGLQKEDNKLKLVQIANPVIQSAVYKL